MNGLSSLGSSALQYAQQGISTGMANLDRDSQTVADSILSSGGDSGAVSNVVVPVHFFADWLLQGGGE